MNHYTVFCSYYRIRHRQVTRKHTRKKSKKPTVKYKSHKFGHRSKRPPSTPSPILILRCSFTRICSSASHITRHLGMLVMHNDSGQSVSPCSPEWFPSHSTWKDSDHRSTRSKPHGHFSSQRAGPTYWKDILNRYSGTGIVIRPKQYLWLKYRFVFNPGSFRVIRPKNCFKEQLHETTNPKGKRRGKGGKAGPFVFPTKSPGVKRNRSQSKITNMEVDEMEHDDPMKLSDADTP